MRISPKQFLQGLLYLTPITLLALASCGGGGGSGSNTTLASYYTLSVSVAGISGVSTAASGVVLRNGGDNLTFTAPGTQPFQHQVLSGSTYNISVLAQPSTTPAQVCTVAGPVSTMPAANTTVGVSCVTGYTIGGTSASGGGVSGLAAGTSVVLQNNGGDNLVVTAASGVNPTDFTFSTPVAATKSYNVSVLTQPAGQTCLTNSTAIGNANGNVADILISCTAITAATPPDQHVYVANSGDNTAWSYSASGVLTTPPASSQTGLTPSAIAVFGGKYAFVTNRGSNTVSAYSVTSGALSAAPIANTVTENTPVAIAVHPSGKFVYVVNQLSNSISAYSITPTGALAAIDADAKTLDMQPSISTGTAYIPVAIAINPAGTYAYVASLGDGSTSSCGGLTTTGCITAYQIDQSTGALTSVPISGANGNYIATADNVPSAIAVDGTYVYVTNRAKMTLSVYAFGGNGSLVVQSSNSATGTDPYSIAINPVRPYVYVANTGSNSVSIFNSGGGGSITPVPTGTGTTGPASISVDSTGQYVYVANSGTSNISAFKITTASPYLTLFGGPYATGSKPVSVTTGP